MADNITRLHKPDFANGLTISSNQVNEELDQLVNSMNNKASRVQVETISAAWTFNKGIKLATTAPVLQAGLFWYDTATQQFRGRQNSQTVTFTDTGSLASINTSISGLNADVTALEAEMVVAKARARNYLNVQGTLAYDSATQVRFTGEIVCMDSTNAHQIVIPAGETVAMTSLTADTWYHYYAVKNITTNAVDIITSTNATLATAPSGFDVLRKLPVSVATDAAGAMRKFQCLIGQGVTRFRFLGEPSDLDLWTSVSASSQLVSFSKCIPTGDSGATCTASIEVFGVGDAGSSTATLLEKSTDDEVTWRRFAQFVGNDNVSLEYALDEFTLRPAFRSVHLRQVSGVTSGTTGQAVGYNKYW